MHLSLVQGIDPSQAFIYQQKAIHSVNNRLSDPVQSLSSGIVAAVVSFLVYDVRNWYHNLESLLIDRTSDCRS